MVTVVVAVAATNVPADAAEDRPGLLDARWPFDTPFGAGAGGAGWDHQTDPRTSGTTPDDPPRRP